MTSVKAVFKSGTGGGGKNPYEKFLVHHLMGEIIFSEGDIGTDMYIVQSGVIDMVIGDTVIETIGADEALGFMSMIDDLPRSSTARARETCELSLIDARTFRFMVDEVPNFSTYIMRVLARRIRGMSKAI